MQPTPTPRFADARQLAVLSLASLARVLVDRDPVLARAIDLIFVIEGDCSISPQCRVHRDWLFIAGVVSLGLLTVALTAALVFMR